jgi:hypothetical protein
MKLGRYIKDLPNSIDIEEKRRIRRWGVYERAAADLR